MTLRLVNWNVRCATPRSWKRRCEIWNRIFRHDPHIICLTETHKELLSRYGPNAICSRPSSEKSTKNGQRKVLLWSREPWEIIDDLEIASMPSGRFVAGVTQTPIGAVMVVGICVPWHHSRARGLNAKRKMWEDHAQYLAALGKVLAEAHKRVSGKRLIVVGDFNQRIRQGTFVPPYLRAALQGAIPESMTIATSALLGADGKRTIDHIALSEDMAAESLSVISNMHGKTKLSDHFGVAAELSAQGV